MNNDSSFTEQEVLFLFDIDGTLLDLFDFHMSAYQEVFQELFNHKSLNRDMIVKYFGLPLKAVLRGVFDTIGIPPTDKNIELGANGYIQRFKAKLDHLTDEIIFPGVFELLDHLKKEDIPTALITGNPEITGEIIVEKSGLSRYYPPGFRFYSNAYQQTKREELIYRAISKFEHLFTGYKSQVVVTGDTKHDIQAALNANCWPAAVSFRNRYYTSGKLEKEGAKFLIKEPADFLALVPAARNYFAELRN